MITRVFRRRKPHIHRELVQCFKQLELPWLCPAIDRYMHQERQSSSTTKPSSLHHPFDRNPPRSLRPKEDVRQLATEADAYAPEEHVPFNGLPPHLEINRSEFTRLRDWNANQIVVLGSQVASVPPIFKRQSQGSITGDIADLLPNLYACVQAGRFDRAAKLVNRMSQLLLPKSPVLLDAHHQYLLGLLSSHLRAPSKDRYENMQRWFELEVRGKDVVPDSRILAIMIKACFATHEGTKLDRTLRRHLSLADTLGPATKADTLASSLLSEAQMARLLRLLPQEFTAPHEDTTMRNDSSLKQPIVERFSVDLSSESEWTNNNTSLLNPAEDDLQELKAADLKGLGLKSLKTSLASMYVVAEELRGEADPSTIAHARQKRLETDVIESSIERWREEAENHRLMRGMGIMNDPLLESHVYEWLRKVTDLVKEEIELSAAAEAREEGKALPEDMDRLLLGPFLRCYNPEKLTAVAMMAFIQVITDIKIEGGANKPLTTVVGRIGHSVAREIRAETIKTDVLTKLEALPSIERRRKLKGLLRSKNQPRMHDEAESEIMETTRPGMRRHQPEITSSIKVKLGALFLSMLVKVAKIPVTKKNEATGRSITEMQPIGVHAWQWKHGKRVGILRINQELLERLKREPVGSFMAKLLPMLIKPGSWMDNKGPYLHADANVVRFRDSSNAQQEYVNIAAKRGDMNQVFKALDVIGSVPWKINRPLFKILADAWNTGEGFAKLAPQDPKTTYPPTPDQSDRMAVHKHRMVMKNIENQATGYHSQRCYQNFQLEVARAFAREEVFYCPHNVDFRGRAYPIPPYFNHMGADYIRGLFLFSNGKKLGEIGLRWLKIHLANVFGYDKERLDDREKFAMDNLAEIYDSAENPLDGNRWWMKSSHPWQTLAACLELKSALDSPVPSEYVSHLPVQQDGTCNGLQHYAALGGDSIGAKQVNLTPGDRPADIYSAVADIVKLSVSKAAAEGHKLALALDGKISRKVVKQPVMTNVYGVTFHGAKEQVARQLLDIYGGLMVGDDVHVGQLAAYVASLIFEALGQMFNGAQAIQEWLGECGARISQAITPEQIKRIAMRREKIMPTEDLKYKRKQVRHKEKALAQEDYQFKSTIVWTTPLGMPVVQPYRSAKVKVIKTSFQDVVFEEPALSDPVSKRKQLQGFPPNFIHSLDSSHMMLSALKCNELGLTFASVHDSFWTHACDVPIMNRILRDAFVLMHSEDIIGRLREEFIARYKGCFHWAPIDSRSPLAKKIIELRREDGTTMAQFTRSNVTEGSQIDELLTEYKRYQLLHSDDPLEVEQGRTMVTPASLLEAEPDAALPVLDQSNLQILGRKDDVGLVAADVPGFTESEHVAHANADEDPETLLEEETFQARYIQQAIMESAESSATLETLATGNDIQDTPTRPTKAKKPSARRRTKIYLWQPMFFPPAPTKGSFDVKTLKDSQYFFS